MPGLPVYHVSKADTLQSDAHRVPSPSEVDHLPLQSNNDPAGVSQKKEIGNQEEEGFCVIYNKDFNPGKSLAEHLASQFASSVHGSADSEHDLAAMVHDFLENGSFGSDFPESSDGENGLPNGPKLLEALQALKYIASPCEKELLTVLTKLSLSIKEIDLVCQKPATDCKGGCIRRLLVKHLRLSGYDAAVCSAKWTNSGKVPGGEYEYIDVAFESNGGAADRLIVDTDFQSQFAIARPTHSYATAMKFLPVIFAGSSEKLEQVLQAMAEAAKLSLSQNAMPLPPWRTLDYMKAKWMSPYERRVVDTIGRINRGPGNSQWRERIRKKQCVEQLRHLKLCIAAETDKNLMSKPAPSDRNRAMYLAKTRRLSTGSPYFEKLKALAFEKPE
ncbi:hypothetical protein GOP47_0019155 [Adiantum capillus-veneris]|nr:hypothetical protein GOP47_0019155 [Adiantum capillus-veneris]